MRQLRFYLSLFILTATLGWVGHAMAGELDEIYRLTDEKKLDQAMKKLDAYLKEHPKDAEARFLQGLIFTGKSQSDEAIRVFRELGADFPDLPEPFNNLAVLYAERGDYENARQALINAVRILPDYATAHENLGDVYAKLASQSYTQALRVNNSNTLVATKLDALKRLFTAQGASGDTPVVAAKTPAKPAADKKAAAAAPAPAPQEPAVVQNVGDAAVRSEVDPAARGGTVAGGAPESEEAPAASAAASPAQAEVERTVHAWAKAWASRNVDEYLAFYSDTDHVPEKFPDREAWRQQRRVAISAAGTIRVKLSNVRVTMTDAGTAQATFMQNYWSRRYQDQVSKTLTLKKEGSSWKIVREQ